MRKIWEGLVSFEHRGTGTVNEYAAAEWLKEFLTKRGCEPQLQHFSAPGSWGHEVMLVMFALGTGAVLGFPWLAAIGFYGIAAYSLGWARPWQSFFSNAISQNVLVEAGKGQRELVLMANYDTARVCDAYRPSRVRTLRIQSTANVVLAAFATLSALKGGLLSMLLGGYFFVQFAALIRREFTAAYVVGANGNATGVAVATQLFLDLSKRPPEGWRLVLALTGAAETGAAGAEALIRSGFISDDALIFNISSVGVGKLHYIKGEGMITYYSYRGELVEAAQKIDGAEAGAFRLAHLDSFSFARRRWRVLTLMRLKDGIPPNWRWSGDRPEAVDWAAVEATYDFARRVLDEVLPSNGGGNSAAEGLG